MINRKPFLRAARLAFAALLLFSGSACRQSAGGLVDSAPGVEMTLAADTSEWVVGPLQWQITLLDSAGAPIEGARVVVRGDMAHAGMIPVEAPAAEIGDGRYTADFEWTMAGDWIVTVTATLADGRIKTASYPYTITAD